MPKVKSALQKTAGSQAHDIATSATPFKASKRRGKLQSDSCSYALAEQMLKSVNDEYVKHANETDAVSMKKYMRGQFEFFGIKAPDRRAIDNQVTSGFPTLDNEGLKCLLTQCWQKEQREFQMFALDMASKHKSILSGDNSETCMESLDLTKTLITTKSWWDTVDMLASNIVGHLAQSEPSSVGPVLDEWISSENLWLRRTAILHQLNYKQATDKHKLFRNCLALSHEREFFIEKAIGWALRQYHRTNPKDVEAFVNKHKDKLAKLSVKEALKHAT